LVRTFGRDAGAPDNDPAAVRLAAAVAELPGAHGFSDFPFWLVEGCRVAQPLAPLLGSRVGEPQPPSPRSLVSVQAACEIDGRWVLVGGPALLGADGEAAALLMQRA